MLGDKFKTGKTIDLDKKLRAYVTKHYGNIINLYF